MRTRDYLIAALAVSTAFASPADARKKQPPAPPVAVRPAPILALPGSPNAATVNYFYERRQEAPLWYGQAGGPQAIADLLTILRRAGVDGYPQGPQVAAQVEARVAAAAGGDVLARKTAERALSNAWVDYVQALQRPNTNVIWGDPALTLKPAHPDRILALLSGSPSIAPHLASASGINPYYKALRDQALLEAGADGTASARTLLNLERARMLPASGKWILVNTAEQRLHLMEGGQSVGSMKVVVGDKEHYSLPTPIIASTMYYAIANPYWHMPDHLVRKAAVKIAKEGQAYMTRNGYEVLTSFGPDAQVVPISSVDWKAVAAGTSKVLIRQKPNSINSMGKMKFPFANKEGIYLHDTPKKEYFSLSNRAKSNGCIRVENYRALASFVMGRDVASSGSAPEQQMALPRGIPVYVTYLTQAPGADGKLATFTDTYGWDRPGVLAGGLDISANATFTGGRN